MNTRQLLSILGVFVLAASIGEPVFSTMSDCPSIRIAVDGERRYVDFGADVRLRMTVGAKEGEIALRGISAFDANETLKRPVSAGQAMTVTAIDSAEQKPIVQAYTHSTKSGIEYVAVYHRDRAAIVVSSFDGEEPRCERLDNAAAAEFIGDLTRSSNATTGALQFVSSKRVYEQLGL